MKTIKTIFLFVCFFLFSSSAFAGEPDGKLSLKQTQALRQFMSKFGVIVAGLEIMREQDKTDWEVVKSELSDLNKVVMQMQKTDSANAYKMYTDELTSLLSDLSKLADQKKKKFFDKLDKVEESCFGCHATHRPNDFIDKSPKVSKK